MDVLLQKFFEKERWGSAIQTAVDKGINKSQLRALKSTETRLALLDAIINGKYEIAPPHQAEIPKDDGTTRIVYVNEGIDRVVLSIINDMLFELCPEMIHPTCTSYQKGIGCGKVVQRLSREIQYNYGWKADLSKYFDSVPIRFIDAAFDKVEEKFGHSAIIDVVRKYYHQDLCFDVDGNLIEHYQSLKQGCAVASWLADVMLYHIDEQLSKLDGYYVRYSDDTLFIGADYEKAMQIMSAELNVMEMKLNPKKVEYLNKDKWFKFLGFSVKGEQISLSKSRLKAFQKEIESRTIKKRDITKRKALNSVINYIYKGNGQYSWATSILPIVNSKRDLLLINNWVMDCIRACETSKRKVGGLGYEHHEDGVVTRGKGANVKANRQKTGNINGYITLLCAKNAPTKEVYEALIRML